MHRRLIPLTRLWLALLLLMGGAGTVGAERRIGGQLKSLNLVQLPPPQTSAATGLLSAASLRLEAGDPTAPLAWEVALEALPVYTDPPRPGTADSSGRGQFLDLERSWNRQGRWSATLAVDRLNLRSSRWGFDWSLGRQAIGFGRIGLVSPLDVIAPFAPDAIDTGVRPGIDALRATRYFGSGGQLGGVVALADRSRNHSYLLSGTWSGGGLDVLGLAGQLRGRPMAGCGLAGSIGEAALQGELAVYRGRRVGTLGGDLSQSFAIAGLESWYRSSGGLSLRGQYLYNGAGGLHPEDYPRVIASAPLREGLSFLLGRHYLLLSPSYQWHPLSTVSTLLIWNLADASWLLRPLLEWSLADNCSLQLFWTVAQGAAPASQPPAEFGGRGDSGGLFLRYYF